MLQKIASRGRGGFALAFHLELPPIVIPVACPQPLPGFVFIFEDFAGGAERHALLYSVLDRDETRAAAWH